jgi:hypothetical protein
MVQHDVLPAYVHTSLQRRTIRTADLALAAADRDWIPVRRSWRLNGRHYGGLAQLSTASATTAFTGILPGLILLGVGAGLTIASATESVMGSLPSAHTGVGSATNGAFLQIGGALGVAVIGSLLNTRYQDMMTSALAPYHVPHEVMQTVLGSVGGALAIAARVGGVLGAALGHLACSAFASGMDLGLTTAACVAAVGCLIALIALPSRDRSADVPPAEDALDDGRGAQRRCPGSELSSPAEFSHGPAGPGASKGPTETTSMAHHGCPSVS